MTARTAGDLRALFFLTGGSENRAEITGRVLLCGTTDFALANAFCAGPLEKPAHVAPRPLLFVQPTQIKFRALPAFTAGARQRIVSRQETDRPISPEGVHMTQTMKAAEAKMAAHVSWDKLDNIDAIFARMEHGRIDGRIVPDLD